MPSYAPSRPLMTEVIRNDTPDVVPTGPLARAPSGSGTSSVTIVGGAMLRRPPARMPPSRGGLIGVVGTCVQAAGPA